jgi:hypothetical protein
LDHVTSSLNTGLSYAAQLFWVDGSALLITLLVIRFTDVCICYGMVLRVKGTAADAVERDRLRHEKTAAEQRHGVSAE